MELMCEVIVLAWLKERVGIAGELAVLVALLGPTSVLAAERFQNIQKVRKAHKEQMA